MKTTNATSSTCGLHGLSIMPFESKHLAGALRLSEEAGWPHRLDDWALSLSVSEGVVALDGTQVVGTALCTRFGAVASLNMIIVDARMRGRGLGRELMRAAITLAEGREMRLIATRAGLPLYERSGFVATGRVAQHQGISEYPASGRRANSERRVKTGGVDDIGRLEDMDYAASRMSRSILLRKIAKRGEVLLAENGFALMREFGQGLVLGPVVAGDDATARALIAEGALRAMGAFLRIDLLEARQLGSFAVELGLNQVDSGIAMSCRTAPGFQGAFTTVALASQAFG